MIEMVNLEKITERVRMDAEMFQHATPFPHIAFDDLLNDGFKEQIMAAFPDDAWNAWRSYSDNFQFKKLACDQIHRIPSPLDRLIFELNSGPVLTWLSDLTGIAQLLPDPWLLGGGLPRHHQSSAAIPRPTGG